MSNPKKTQKLLEKSADSKTKKYKNELPPIPKVNGGVYFYCGSIIGRKNVFVTDEYVDMLTNAFRTIELKKDIKNIGFVVMPNFFYWMFRLSDEQNNPVPVYGELKKHVAWEIIQNLKNEMENGEYELVDLFKSNSKVGRSKPDRILKVFEEYAEKFKNNKKYRIWAPRTELRLIDSDDLFQEKLAVMKNAPVSERWQMVDNADRYPYLYLSDEFDAKGKTKLKDFLSNLKIPVSVNA